jgi:hypothetical protein
MKNMKLVLFTAIALTAQEAPLAVDRGLPAANWNNDAGITARSNVRWTLYSQGFVGDDFVIGQPGEKWTIDTLRVWAVPGARGIEPATLGDVYQDIRLYIGSGNDDLTPVSTGRLTRGSNAVEGADIVITEAAPTYEDFGAQFKIYQIEFRNLNLTVNGGERQRFGAWGLGRATGDKGEIYPWFTHGSNAVQSQVRADGADGKLLLFEAAGRYAKEYTASGAAWNKDSDLNVQVFASQRAAKSRDSVRR